VTVGCRLDQRTELFAFGHAPDIRSRCVVRKGLVGFLELRDGHEEQPPLGGDALQLRQPLVDELISRRTEHAVHGLRREDSAGWGQTLDAFGDDHRLAVDVTVLVDHLTGVEPDAHLHGGIQTISVQASHLGLHLPGGGDGATGRCEGRHQTVTHLLDQRAALVGNRPSGHLVDATTDLAGGGVAERLVELGGFDQVAEEHGHRSFRNLGPQALHRRSVRQLSPGRILTIP